MDCERVLPVKRRGFRGTDTDTVRVVGFMV